MKNIIKQILSEEVDKKTEVIVKYTQNGGLIRGSKLVGGYDNLKQILKGTDYLTRECMVKTIKDYFNQPTSRPYLDLKGDLDMEHIQIDEGHEYFITLNELSKKGFGYIVYELDEYGVYDEVHTANSDYDALERNGKYFLDTIHLYELVDGIMEKYEEDNSNRWIQESIKLKLNEESKQLSNEDLVEMFYKHLIKRGNINFHGLIIKPVFNQNVLFFDVENPNDISYSKYTIEDHFDKLFNKFIRLFALDRFKIKFNSNKYLVVNGEKIYLNKEDSKIIKKLITNVKKFRISFNDFDMIGDIWYWSEVFNIKTYGDGGIYLEVEGVFKNYQLDYGDGKIKDIGIDEVDYILEYGRNKDRFLDYIQDELYDDAMTYLWNLPTICDPDSHFISVGVKLR